jgi:hypothetical protein
MSMLGRGALAADRARGVAIIMARIAAKIIRKGCELTVCILWSPEDLLMPQNGFEAFLLL